MLCSSFFLIITFNVALSYHSLQPPIVKNHTIPKNVGEPLYLTPYIKTGNIEVARKLSLVTRPLDGLEDGEQPETFTGFLTVKDDTENNMFFWFVPATDVEPSDAPVVIWLQGGPGASSLFGLLELHGPFTANFDVSNNVKAVLNPWAWTKKANVIYIDNPVGAGFSYAQDEGLPRSQEDVARDMYEALTQWFTMFPEYQANEFYAFGESYAGKFVPTISKKIHDENPTADIKINLVGLGIGNGFTSPEDSAIYADYMYGVGLLDIAQRKKLLRDEEIMKNLIRDEKWHEASEAWRNNQNYRASITGCDNDYEINLCSEPKERYYYEEFVNLKSTRKAIHVGNRPFDKQGGNVFESMSGDFMRSERETLEFLLENYRVLIYNGNFDIICNHYGIKEMFKAMKKWSGRKDYIITESKIYRVGEEVAGYLKRVGNLRQLVMRNSGHMVPLSQPKYAQDMFERFLDGRL